MTVSTGQKRQSPSEAMGNFEWHDTTGAVWMGSSQGPRLV